MSAARLKHFGWGREGEGLTAEEEAFVMVRSAFRHGAKGKRKRAAPRRHQALAAERLFDGTTQLSLCLGFPRRPLSAGANRRNRPKATDAAHAFDRRPLFFKHLTAARFAEF